MNKLEGPLPDFATGEDKTPKAEIDFIKAQAPKAKYICSVCGGSAILAAAGVLSGKKATTNKAFFKMIVVRPVWLTKPRWLQLNFDRLTLPRISTG